MKKLKTDMLDWLDKYKSTGGKITTYVCPHCQSILETPKAHGVGSKGYWDSLKVCYECEKPSFVKVWPNGKTEVLIPQSETKCPECLRKTSQEELNMFDGLCEDCSEGCYA